MARRKSSKQRNPKFLMGIGLGLLLVLGLLQLGQGLIDTESYRERIEQVVREKTGQEVSLHGKVTVSLLPVPTLYLPGFEMHAASNNAAPAPTFTAELVQIRPAFGSLFSGSPEVGSITLQHPALQVEQGTDRHVHWGWLNSELLKSLAMEPSSPISIKIEEGQILYRSEATDESVSLENIEAAIQAGNTPQMDGSLVLRGHGMRFSAELGNAGGGQILPLTAKVYTDDKNSVDLQGKVDWSGETPRIEGQFQVQTDDVLPWLLPKNEQRAFDQITNEAVQRVVEKVTLPVQLSAQLTQQDTALQLDKVTLQGLNSAGKGQILADWEDMPSLSVKMDFTTLDYGLWQLAVLTALESQRKAVTPSYQVSDEQPASILPENIQVKLDVKADKMTVGAQAWQDANFQVQLADAAITVNRFHINLPGDSILSLFGVVSQEKTRGLRFEGSMETEGKSLRELLTVFDESASDLPETGFGAFSARSNIFVSPEQMRLSEADVHISELHLNGGLVAYFDANPRLEADVRLKEINFDYFRNVWRERQESSEHKDFFLKFDRSMNFNWLRKLRTTIDFKVNVEQFTFLDREGESASFRLFAKEGEFGIYNIRFYYPGEVLEASFTLDVKGEQPNVNVLLNANELNTEYFSWKEKEPEIRGPRRGRNLDDDEGDDDEEPDSDVDADDAAKTDAAGEEPAKTEAAKSGDAKAPAGTDEKKAPEAKETAPAESADKKNVTVVPQAQQVQETVPAAAMPDPYRDDLATARDEDEQEDYGYAGSYSYYPELDDESGDYEASPSDNVNRNVIVVPQAKAVEETAPAPAADAQSIEDLPKPGAKKAADKGKEKEVPAVTKRWSEELIDMSWMDGINGNFDITLGKLIHGDKVISRLKARAKLENNLLTFQGLSFVYWGGRCEVSGSIYGGRVPGVSIGFTLYNADFNEVLSTLADRTNITGKFSVSGTLSTSGVNYLSWISQADAKLVLSGRGVNVDNFNLQGVSDAVAVSRTASDVFNNVNLALLKGSTNLSVDGNINVKGGAVRTPGITLKTGTVTGNLTGDVKLVPWTMDLSALFQFPAMTSETIPTMIVELKGPVDNPQVNTDTSSLEAYVAKRIIGR